LRVADYTQNSENKAQVMKEFEEGHISLLFAMKCLDEGVDIPRTEVAIFCSSTGTPRQFIQRRGRVIRTHPHKEYARIYDLVVFPEKSDIFMGQSADSLERNFIKSELKRVVEFARLAQNYGSAMEACNEASMGFNVDVYALQDEIQGYEIQVYGSEDCEDEEK
ncbi:MAG: helicase-related protein, partial [Betaproteobacteria bacterium]